MKYAAGVLDEALQFPARYQILGSTVLHREALRCVAARQRRDQQLLRIPAFRAGFPHGIAFDHLDGFDTRFPALSPLDHALHGFKSVIIHRVRTTDADHQCFLDLTAKRQFEIRQAPRHGQRRTSYQRELQTLGRVHHPLRFLETPRKMLVVVDGNRAPVLLEHVNVPA